MAGTGPICRFPVPDDLSRGDRDRAGRRNRSRISRRGAGRWVAMGLLHPDVPLVCVPLLCVRRNRMRHAHRFHQQDVGHPADQHRPGETGKAAPVPSGQGAASSHSKSVYRNPGGHSLQPARRGNGPGVGGQAAPDGPAAVHVGHQSCHHQFDGRWRSPQRSHQQRDSRVRNRNSRSAGIRAWCSARK